jgi:drug/metabolite transporter (DMT)-like permease
MLATSPVFVAVLSLLAQQERPSAKLLFGVSLSLTGVFVLMLGSPSGFMSAERDVLGAVLVLIGAICWATYTVFSKPYLARYSPLRLTTITMVFGTLVLDVLAIPSLLTQRWIEISLVGWTGLTYSFGLAIVFGYVVWDIGIDRVGPGRTAVYQNLIPVIAAIVSYVLLGEALGGLQIGGAGMVLLGIYLARKT